MEEAAGRIGKSISKLGREIKTWPALAWIKETVDAFKKTMPLITDLRNPAMRQRHWEDLMVRVLRVWVARGSRVAGGSGVSGFIGHWVHGSLGALPPLQSGAVLGSIRGSPCPPCDQGQPCVGGPRGLSGRRLHACSPALRARVRAHLT